MKHILFLVTFLISFSFLKAQEHFYPGTIISLNGDSIFGLIEYNNWEENPNIISFKKTFESEIVTYNPIGIFGFTVKNERYESAIIDSENSPYKTNDLNFEKKPNIITDTTFLQTIFEGKKSLYFYKNEKGKEQFYIKNKNIHELLIYKKYLYNFDGLNKFNGTTGKLENKKYVGQLNLYLKDLPEIQVRTNTLQYTKKNLNNLFVNYYKETDNNYSFYRKPESVLLNYYGIAGVSFSTLRFKSGSIEYLENLDLSASPGIAFGAALQIVLPRNHKRYKINNEIFFTNYNIIGYYENIISSVTYTEYTLSFQYTYLKINNLLNISLPSNKTNPFLNIGLSNGYAINSAGLKKEEGLYYNVEKLIEGEAFSKELKLEQSLIIGVGNNFNKKIFFETRFEIGTGMAISPINSKSYRVYGLFGYYF